MVIYADWCYEVKLSIVERNMAVLVLHSGFDTAGLQVARGDHPVRGEAAADLLEITPEK
jgi:hypothetical protein